MLVGMQKIVQQRYYGLLMGLVGGGFVLLMLELIGYQHFEGLQIIGFAATIVGAVTAFAGIRANAQLRRILAGVFVVLAIIGLFGTVQHNAKRLGGDQRPPFGQNQPGGQAGPAGQDRQGGQGQPGQPGGPGEPGGFARRFRIPAPPLAPLSLSGFCLLGTVVLLGKREDEGQ